MTSPGAIMEARSLCRFRRSSTSKANLSVLIKCWAPILLSKLSESSAILGKGIKCIC